MDILGKMIHVDASEIPDFTPDEDMEKNQVSFVFLQRLVRYELPKFGPSNEAFLRFACLVVGKNI